jgi:hypothetical protein
MITILKKANLLQNRIWRTRDNYGKKKLCKILCEIAQSPIETIFTVIPKNRKAGLGIPRFFNIKAVLILHVTPRYPAE